MASNDEGSAQAPQSPEMPVLEGEAQSGSNIGARVPTPPLNHQEEGTLGSAANSNLGQVDILRALADLIKNPAPQPSLHPPAPRSIVERFLKLSPRIFHGKKEEDASTAEFWLEETERLFERIGGSSSEKVQCAVAALQENAYHWWKTVDKPVNLSWEFFVEKFENRYVGEVYKEAMKRKFLDLKQGALSVAEYESEFTKYSRYATDLVNSGRKRCFYFQEGLNDEYKTGVVGHRYEDFTALLGHALELERIEKSKRARWERKQQKRGQTDSTPFRNKKFKGGSQSFQGGNQKQGSQAPVAFQFGSVTVTQKSGTGKFDRPLCSHCGRFHPGECWRKKGACFLCGSMEHRMDNCPRKYSNQGNKS